MRGEEHELEAAGEERERHEHVAAMRHGDAHGRGDAPSAAGLCAFARARLANRQCEQGHRGGEEREGEHRDLPAVGVDQPLTEGGHDERPERPRGSDDADRARPLLRWHRTRNGADQHTEATSRRSNPDQEAADLETAGNVARQHHEEQAGRVDERRGDQDRTRAEAIRDRAHERLGDAPHDVLDRDGEAERRSRNAQLVRHGPHEEAQALAHTHAHRDDRAAGDEQHEHGAAIASRGHRQDSNRSRHRLA